MAVAGPVLIVIALVFVLPPLFLATGMIFSALLGWLSTLQGEASHEGSELIDCNT